jgi:hypothetical protein
MACSHWVFKPYFGIRCVWTPFISRYRKNFELRTTSDKQYYVGSFSIVFLHFLPVLKTLYRTWDLPSPCGRPCRPSAGLRAADLAPWWRGWALCGVPRQYAGNRTLHRHRLHQLRRLGDLGPMGLRLGENTGNWPMKMVFQASQTGIEKWRWGFNRQTVGYNSYGCAWKWIA